MAVPGQHSPPAPSGNVDILDLILRRLDQLEQKLDALRASRDPSEIVSDHDWRAHEAASKLAPAAAAFVETLARRNQLWADKVRANANAPWTPELEAQAAAKLDPLWDHLVALACELAATPAGGPAGIRIKALALRELCEEQSDDIVHRLAASLAADLLGQPATAAASA